LIIASDNNIVNAKSGKIIHVENSGVFGVGVSLGLGVDVGVAVEVGVDVGEEVGVAVDAGV
jgi:hypothetical protein